MSDILFVVLGVSGGTILLCGAWGLRCLVMGLLGYEELPKLRRKKKIPRKRRVLAPHVATSRGIVGQRIRRSNCVYTTIIPQTDARCQGEFAPARRVAMDEGVRLG